MNYPVKITVNKDYAVNTVTIKKWEEPKTYQILLHDIPDLTAALYELQELVNQVNLGVAIETVQIQSSHDIVISVIGELFGIKRYGRIWVDNEFRNKIASNKKAEKKARKMIDIESVKHDIGYAINMLRSLYPEDSKEWTTNQVLTWLYYILHKQFGEPLPEEIQTAQSKLKEEKPNDSRPST